MGDYKRLTIKNEENGLRGIDGKLVNQRQKPLDVFGEAFNIAVTRLAELEDKIENGTLIELPCKVGDTVYRVEKCCEKCSYYHEDNWDYSLWCDKSKEMFELDGDNDCIYCIDEIEFTYNHIENLGENIFLTKTEAEEKLKELKGEV